MARKSKADEWLTPDGLLRVKGWARDGLTDEQIADKMHIAPSTFYSWQKAFPEFSETISAGKAPVDEIAVDSLFKSVTGYYVTVKEPIKLKTKKQLKDKGTIEEERIEYVERQIYIPGNVNAQIYWTKNRKPRQWKDRPVDIVTDADSASADDALTAALKEEAAKIEAGEADAAE